MSDKVTVEFVTVEQFNSTVQALQQTIEELKSSVQKLTELTTPKEKSQKEMTDEHALRILTGDLKGNSNNECVKILGLSYGQIYSCRGEYTFRHIHKKLQEQGFKNPWKK